MDNKILSGIERELVLQYLTDANVPVTLTPLDKDIGLDGEVHPLSSAVFPVAVKGEQIKVEKGGKIILENTGSAVKSFAGRLVKVEFYFNRVGLYFTSKVDEINDSLVIYIPENIGRIQDKTEADRYDFSGNLYFECRTQSDINVSFVPWKLSTLFSKPAWSSIPLENQKKAKSYLEMFVEQAKVEKNIGNGVHLIPVCNYLTYEEEKGFEAVEDRMKPLSILYVDHERIVLGTEAKNFNLVSGAEYALKFSWKLKNGPLPTRDIFVTSKINKIYTDVASSKYCADLVYTTIQQEDIRFLYEKATSLILG